MTDLLDAPLHDGVTAPKGRRRMLAVLAGTLLVASIAGAGTFASFSASTTNSSSFATGTLTLTDSVNGNTACLSTAGGVDNNNSNGTCDVLWNLTVKKPGDVASATVDLVNTGTLGASGLDAFVTGACSSGTTGSVNGSGNLCGSLQFYVETFTTANDRSTSNAAQSTCYYGGNAPSGTPASAALCTFGAGQTLADFATQFPSSSTTLSIPGALAATNGTKFLKVGIQLPSAAANSVQGRTASIGISWRALQ